MKAKDIMGVINAVKDAGDLVEICGLEYIVIPTAIFEGMDKNLLEAEGANES